MKCPVCGKTNVDVVVTGRPTENRTVFRRRRECSKDLGGCGSRWTTYEAMLFGGNICASGGDVGSDHNTNEIMEEMHTAVRH
ncbi:MAG: hypothetical protein GF411_14465 [Candidatus Lokiarchaeota archaeon]|nr:hypothetical protein [Candidatus Lokiarchaeota archaeon]